MGRANRCYWVFRSQVSVKIAPGLNPIINFQFFCSFRVVDGAVGGEFLRELKKLIENPLEMLL